MRRISACLVSALLLLLVTSCGEGYGDCCSVNSDCASGLSCCNPQYGNGICGPLECIFPGVNADAAVSSSADVASAGEIDADSASVDEAPTASAPLTSAPAGDAVAGEGPNALP